jgi:hypothetical protein
MEAVMCNLRRIHFGVVRIVAAWTICAAVFAASASAGPTVTSKTVEPAVIPGDGSSGAVVTVRTDLPASSVVIDLAGFLRAFLNEIKAQGGQALTTQAATAITALTVRAAVVLEIPLERTIEKAP